VPRLPAPASDDAYLNQKPEDAKTTKKLLKGLSRQQMKMGGKMIDTKPKRKKTKGKKNEKGTKTKPQSPEKGTLTHAIHHRAVVICKRRLSVLSVGSC
jgi:hypothetical protein